ncbi:MAG: hypothetical protein GY790_07420 [Bacteroidetes bacterium]|nr:hypothetical protein [Bacteroidota bacterium]
MDASDLKHLIDINHYSPADLERVNDLCKNYPMFNLAHMLKVRIRESLGYEKEQELKVAAVYAVDRRKLFRMVSEVAKPEIVEDEPLVDESEGIRFSDEPHHEAEVIIVQHAPYAGVEASGDLLELDEDEQAGDFILDEDEPDEIKATTLIEAVTKDEVEMEEHGTVEREPPAESAPDPVSDTEAEARQVVPRANSLILDFLREDPGPIRADKSTAGRKDVSLASIREHDGFITDTLAQIYIKQGLYAKAIYAYEKLSLKYPEKSAYFAAQIEKIGNINHS